MGSELRQLLEQEAQAEQDRALAEARTRAEEIIAAARREAEEIVASGRRRADDERTQGLVRVTSTASLRAAALVLAAKDEAIRKVFEQAEADLRSGAADPKRRRAMLLGLVREAMRGVAGGRVLVVASPGDVEAVRDACRELGLDAEVRESPDVADGIRLATPDGRAVVENTVPSRLARARREMVSRVAEILWSR